MKGNPKRKKDVFSNKKVAPRMVRFRENQILRKVNRPQGQGKILEKKEGFQTTKALGKKQKARQGNLWDFKKNTKAES